MASTVYLDDFTRGLDTRRLSTATGPGALLVAHNVVIDSGGQVRKRYPLVLEYQLPDGAFGFRSVNGILTTWGSGPRPAALPAIVAYVRLPHPTLPDLYPMTDVTCVRAFNGLPYVIATYLDNTVWHFYDGKPIFDWVSEPVTTLTALASALARVIRANFPAYYATSAGPVLTVTGPLNTTFTLLASVTNRGTQPNAQPTVTVVQSATPARPQIVRVELFGAYETEDRWSVTIGGIETGFVGLPVGVPTQVIVQDDFMYGWAGSTLFRCKLGDPTKWRSQLAEPSNTGAGSIFVTSHDNGSGDIVAAETLGDMLAIFTQRSTQLWKMDPDPVLNRRVTTIQNMGSYAGAAVVGYIDGNVAFLSRQGIRTLRLGDDAVRATTDDIGTLIDEFVQNLLHGKSLAELARGTAVVDPREGRMILSIGTTALVFSYHPKSRVSAWTVWDLPVEAKYWIVQNDELLLYGIDRSVWSYAYREFDDTEARVVLPAHDAKNPMAAKFWESMDIASEGRWRVYVHDDARTLTNPQLIGEMEGTTFQKGAQAISMESTGMILEFRSVGSGKHVLSIAGLRHAKTKDD